ncbi:threonine aldolase [Elizabethkingia anophelis]|nr:threonine aldolase [Elizabethkingia anophelis]MDV3529570.1 threonine aldolase [Elizabethkingia anophelis]
MNRFSFKNDYAEGCHANILKALVETNREQQIGYGGDQYSAIARDMIKERFNSPEADVYFVSGGTQANLLTISSILRPHQSVISAESGHIFTNEAGAIEATGHKVHAARSEDGKLSPEACREVLDTVTNQTHVVKPKMLYISNTTELGTHYTREELEALSGFCKEHNLYLFIDGARLGHALTVEGTHVTPEDIARLADVFYLGGTKNGALIGEAIVIVNPELKEDFGFHVKQKGALLAKGRLIGIQFMELMKDNLYFDLARSANQKAMKIKAAFETYHCSFLTDSYSNQLFPIIPNSWIEKLAEEFDFYVWKKIDEEKSAIRLITSWATPEAEVDSFIASLKRLV